MRKMMNYLSSIDTPNLLRIIFLNKSMDSVFTRFRSEESLGRVEIDLIRNLDVIYPVVGRAL